ncbi:MAG: hypothetical protein KJP15_05710 [Gammaproteobacteria bacterium]|nr:hypothetical protein [Gammaproteobacteria bacterium]
MRARARLPVVMVRDLARFKGQSGGDRGRETKLGLKVRILHYPPTAAAASGMQPEVVAPLPCARTPLRALIAANRVVV